MYETTGELLLSRTRNVRLHAVFQRCPFLSPNQTHIYNSASRYCVIEAAYGYKAAFDHNFRAMRDRRWGERAKERRENRCFKGIRGSQRLRKLLIGRLAF